MQVLKGSRESLLTPLTTVSGIIETHQTVPILSNVLIQSDGSKVSFTGSNLEIQMRSLNRKEIRSHSPFLPGRFRI